MNIFRKCLGGSLASTSGGHFFLSFFCLPILRPQDGPVERVIFFEKTNAFSTCFGRNRDPMQHGARLARCLLGAMPPSVGSKKYHKAFKNNGLGHFWGTSFGGAIWTIRMQKAFPWSVALVSFCTEARPCSMALIFEFWMFLLVPYVWPRRGVQNVIESMLVCLF